MKRVGEVVRVAGGLAVVRSPDESFPDPGTAVLTDDLASAGHVVDVFGPVDRPYVAVSPDDDAATPSLLGEALYAR